MFRLRDSAYYWLAPIILILTCSILIFLIVYFIDYNINQPLLSWVDNFLAGDRNTYRYTLTSSAQSVAATLGIMIAIVLLIVQLTSNRYTPKVIDIFITHRINIIIISSFAITIIITIWTAHSINENFLPRFGAFLSLGMMTFCYCAIIPYFLYLFNLLKPVNIIEHIRREAILLIKSIHEKPNSERKIKHTINHYLEQLSDIALSAVQIVDSEIAHRCVWALQSIIDTYIKEKEKFNKSWYNVDESHLTGSPKHIIEEIVRREAWVEYRALRHMRQIYALACGKISDLTSQLAQTHRAIGAVALETKDFNIIDLIIKSYNSLIRTSIALNDGRACNDTLYQYRLLAERILEIYPSISKKIANYFIYYSNLFAADEKGHNFSSAIYDLRKLTEKSFKIKASNYQEFLNDFLKFQYQLDYIKYPRFCNTLWKSYIILASFYLFWQDRDSAWKIFGHMKRVPWEHLLDIKMEIAETTEPQFWEITDRIINYDYIPQEQKEKLNEFFDWFLAEIRK